EFLFLSGSRGGFDFDNRGNHFAGFFNDHRVTDSNILPFDFLLVMQSGAGNSAPTDQHRLQDRDRSQGAGSSDLDENIEQSGLDAFRFIFVGNRPSGGFGSKPEPLTLA